MTSKEVCDTILGRKLQMIKKSHSRKLLLVTTMTGALIASPLMLSPATAAPLVSSEVKLASFGINSKSPFGNGSTNQTYKYSDSIKTFEFKVSGVPNNTKLEIKKWNWGASKWETVKIYNPSTSTQGSLTYKISTPKSVEGKTEVYAAYIPATATSKAWWGEHTYIRTASRASMNLPAPFGGLKELSTRSSSWTLNGLVGSVDGIYLQELKNGKWQNVYKIKKTRSSNGMWTLNYTTPVRYAGTTTSYRFYHYANDHAKAFAGSVQKVAYKAEKTTIHDKSVWQGIGKRWTVNMNAVATNVQVLNGKGRTVYLQKYDTKGKRWVNVSSSRLGNEGWAKAKVTIPKVATQGSVSYRTYVPADHYFQSDTSSKITVKYEDPRKYTGLRKNVYSHIKKYCPNIIIDTPKPNGKWDGIARWGQQHIEVVSGLSSGRFKKVSLHECAHVLQFKAYGGDYKALEKDGNRIYGGKNGLEQMADCMAYKMGAEVKHATYTSNCSGVRGTSAAKILSGKRA